jgi:hypothetical protein
MKIYHHDQDGKFIAEGVADADPLEPGRWLIPANATNVAPPDHVEGSTRHFIAGGWEYREIPQPEPEPVQPEYVPTYRELRAMEYPPMADYIDGVVKGDQAQIDKYIADCLAVKSKYPKSSSQWLAEGNEPLPADEIA